MEINNEMSVANMNADLSDLRIDHSKRENQTAPPGRRKLYFRIGIVAAAALVILILTGVWDAISSRAVPVKVTTATMRDPAQSRAVLTSSGYVVAQQKAAIASKATGRLVYLGVVEGDAVRKNQVIARLEDDDMRAQLEAAKANLRVNQAELKEAENNYQRQQNLFEDGLIAKMELEAAEARYKRILASIDLSEARVEEAEVALENTRIRAPFDGTVLTKNAEVGEVVAPMAAGSNTRAAVVTIADMNSLQVEADVSESNIEKIRIGQPARIALDAYPNYYYDGYAAKIIPTADRSKGTVMVKVAFENYDSKVLPEMSAKVTFLSEGAELDERVQPALVVPETAIVNRKGKKVVYAVRGNTAIENPVETGRSFDGSVEILSGLKEGEQVITEPSQQITNGTNIVVE